MKDEKTMKMITLSSILFSTVNCDAYVTLISSKKSTARETNRGTFLM